MPLHCNESDSDKFFTSDRVIPDEIVKRLERDLLIDKMTIAIIAVDTKEDISIASRQLEKNLNIESSIRLEEHFPNPLKYVSTLKKCTSIIKILSSESSISHEDLLQIYRNINCSRTASLENKIKVIYIITKENIRDFLRLTTNYMEFRSLFYAIGNKV